MKEKIHICDGISGGYKNNLLPIPARSGGKWYSRQWFWWGFFFRKIRCVWLGHNAKWVDYDQKPEYYSGRGTQDRSFVSLECIGVRACGSRFVIYYKDPNIK